MGLLGKRTSVVRISPLAVAALCAALLFPAIRIIFLPAYLLPAIPLLKSSDGNIPELLIELLFTLPALLLGIIALISIRRQRPHIQGENYALVGITLSSIATILCFIGFIESVTEGHDNASRLERCMNN